MLSLLVSVFPFYTVLSTVALKYSHINTTMGSVMSTLSGVVQCLCVRKPSEAHL